MKYKKKTRNFYLLGLEAVTSTLRRFSVLLLFSLAHFFNLVGVTFECHLVENFDGFKVFGVIKGKSSVRALVFLF